MVRGTEKALEERSSAARAGTSQRPPAGPSETAANYRCPICLGDIENAAYMAFCLHRFCFTCIWQWARGRDACPLCRQPFKADNNYKEYMVGLSTHRRRNTTRIRSRSPQRHYNLCRRSTDYDPSAGKMGPVGRNQEQKDNVASGPSNATSQQAPTASASRERIPPSAGERLASPAAAPYIHFSMESKAPNPKHPGVSVAIQQQTDIQAKHHFSTGKSSGGTRVQEQSLRACIEQEAWTACFQKEVSGFQRHGHWLSIGTNLASSSDQVWSELYLWFGLVQQQSSFFTLRARHVPKQLCRRGPGGQQAAKDHILCTVQAGNDSEEYGVGFSAHHQQKGAKVRAQNRSLQQGYNLHVEKMEPGSPQQCMVVG
ncbi:hypothetical protein QYF61_022249 [Mycteria americana]|uniref:RING-type E3 ubiquitin transferase n=1 Tax=Mycteria americana TaxID=33587 RepID=A0AAN7NWC0_MYCAM|nr:hypothetical protein QYF61_022249 [Mycteria americana]